MHEDNVKLLFFTSEQNDEENTLLVNFSQQSEEYGYVIQCSIYNLLLQNHTCKE